jgi:hypothetical protein
VLSRKPGIFASLDAFEHQFHFGQFLETIHVLPRRPLRVAAVRFDTFGHRLASGRQRDASGVAGRMTGEAISRVCSRETQLGFCVASAKTIHGQRQHGATGVLHALDDLFRVFPAKRHIELIPRSGSARFGHFLVRHRCPVRQNLHRVFRTRCAGRAEFGLRMEHLLVARRTKEDRRVKNRSEKFGTDIGV